MNSCGDRAVAISIVIPAYNEEKRIANTINAIISFCEPKYHNYEIVVVDDGSDDATNSIIESHRYFGDNLRLIKLSQNRGKGYAVKQGVMQSRGEIVLYNDADGSTPIEELSKLEKYLAAGYDIAIGSRELPDESRQVYDFRHRRIIGRIFNRLVRILAVKDLADTQCGFKMFTAKAAADIFPYQTIPGFCFDVELLHIAQLRNYKIKEVAVNWHAEKGSKVNIVKDSLRMFFGILRVCCYSFLKKYARRPY